jgi:hypothetical protein
MHIHFLLHAGDRFHPARRINVAFAGDDALGRSGDGLQAGGAETVDGHAGRGDGAAGAQGDLARDIAAGGAFRIGAAYQHVFHFARFDPARLIAACRA